MQRQPLRQAQTIDNVFTYAYWHLGQQDFTIKELRTKLERKTDNQQWIDTVIAQLIDNGYLKNDAEFAIRYCELAFSKQLGKGAIKRKLQLRGLGMTDIDNAIEIVMEQQNIDLYALATSRLLNKFDHFHHTSREKIFSQMTTKGFSHAEIEHALAQHPEQDSLRSKLAIKADKVDLKAEIIKLYKKGKGKTLILQELKQRLIDISEFEDTLYQLMLTNEVDFYLSCKNELAKKRFDVSDYKQKTKAYAYLTRKGFDSEQIKYAMCDVQE
ncbi:RecX family transcriptional regulator [Shewanella aestuarii]|uniref:Regulatory protein RecX n=1 Tax=Shewanella aestuarii TaxID=1028752 RepID=A0A6G9QMB0_9GAMM|nr:RecX family transcriptional regulator [Shewanella aestuarii]QIR14971.1 RecX family transcriptional regulator [Shewanella aestuarii]